MADHFCAYVYLRELKGVVTSCTSITKSNCGSASSGLSHPRRHAPTVSRNSVGYGIRGPGRRYRTVSIAREVVFKRFHGLETEQRPFANLPQRDRGRWGYGLTADKMAECRWLKPRLVAQIGYTEWTDGERLRHAKFIALRDDKDAREVDACPLAPGDSR